MLLIDWWKTHTERRCMERPFPETEIWSGLWELCHFAARERERARKLHELSIGGDGWVKGLGPTNGLGKRIGLKSFLSIPCPLAHA